MSAVFGLSLHGEQLPLLRHEVNAALELVAPRKQSLAERLATSDQLASALSTFDAEDLPPEVRAELEAELRDAVFGSREKVDNTSYVLASIESDEMCCQREIERLDARKTRLARQRQRLEGYVISVLTAAGLPKFDGHTSTLTVKKNPPALQIDDPAQIPADYLVTPEPPPPPAPKPDNALIKAALKHDIAVPGCRLTQGLRLVRS